MTPKVSIIILNWNGWRNIIECLESVRLLAYPNYRIVVIDNGSSDGSVDKIKAWAAGELYGESRFFPDSPAAEVVRWIDYDLSAAKGLPDLEAEIEDLPSHCSMVIIQTGANLGYAGGNNVGIRYAIQRGAEYIWLLNNDTIVDRDSLTEMIRLAESSEQVGMVGSKLLYYDRPNIIQAAGGCWFNFWQGLSHQYGWLEEDHGQWDNVFQPYYISGASLLVRGKVLETVGYLNEVFFLYGEELEWQIRARRQGWLIFYCPGAKVWHKENASLGYKSPVVEFYSTRNNL